SAAFWSESYGGPAVQPLTSASGGFLASPPADFAEEGFLRPRGALHIARAEEEPFLKAIEETFAAPGVQLERRGRAEIEAIVPGIRPGWDRALTEPSCADIDVAALHAAYLRAARRAGVTIRPDSRVATLAHMPEGWRIEGAGEAVLARIVVNAAGAWAAAIAAMAGALPIAITPMRRT